jgi:outer membrane protein OmpA-like peptidoglycan-associated protein
LNGAAQNDVPHLEDAIANIVEVLVKTKALEKDPLPGRQSTLFYGQVLAAMKASNFHPGNKLNLLAESGSAADVEKVRPEAPLQALAPEQWARLRPVGQLRIDPIVFRRASATLSEQSERDLQELARRLQSYPRFYVRILGHARAEGDAEANRQLAQVRADAASQYLVSQGVSASRLRTEAAPGVVATGEAQAVSFVVGQLPY